MKKKLLITLSIVTIFSVGIGLYVNESLNLVIFKINNIVKIQKVQLLQEKLSFQLQEVQSGLISKDTPFAMDVNTLTEEVAEMSDTMNSCFDCHHSEDITSQLSEIHKHMEIFKLALSRAFTIRANYIRYNNALNDAFTRGHELTELLNQLIFSANKRLVNREKFAMVDIKKTQQIIRFLALCIPFLVLITGFFLLKSFTTPLSALLDATRKLTGGDLTYRVSGLRHEFGELAESFNSMAESIMEQIKNMQRAEQMAAVGQLAAGLAHEIKNPLAGIKVSMEVLASELDIDEDDRRILRLVILEINHINSLINELLNFARPSIPNFESVDINQALSKTIEAASFSTKKQIVDDTEINRKEKINFTKEFTPDNPLVNADPAQLHQIFLNILLNCIEIMPTGGDITVKTFLADKTDYICVNISDTGPGMDQIVLKKLFDPFFTTKKKGTGLGLAICRRLVEQHEGEIVAYNNSAGAGASFSIYLPIYKSAKELLSNEK